MDQYTKIRGCEPNFTECLIDGNKVPYDACSEDNLDEAKKFYGSKYKYIGSSHTTFHNGVENNWDELHHFFVKI